MGIIVLLKNFTVPWEGGENRECLQSELAKTKHWTAHCADSKENVPETVSSAISDARNITKSQA